MEGDIKSPVLVSGEASHKFAILLQVEQMHLFVLTGCCTVSSVRVRRHA